MKKINIFIQIILVFWGTHAFAQIETKIQNDSLPAIIHNELHKKYASYVVNSVLRIVDMHQNIVYNVEKQKNATLIRLVYSSKGILISKEKSKIYSFDGTEPIKSKPIQTNDGHNHQH